MAKAELARRQREAWLAEWAFHKARLRLLAELLGFPNPFPKGERGNNNNEERVHCERSSVDPRQAA